MTKTAQVCISGVFAGELKEDDEGQFHFTYDKNYLLSNNKRPVSLTLPLQEQPYESPNLFPFFDGLIPEGWLLDVAIKNWKLNPNDRMDLLLKTCKDCIGNVEVLENE